MDSLVNLTNQEDMKTGNNIVSHSVESIEEVYQYLVTFESFKAMSKANKQALLTGPNMALRSGGEDLAYIPKRLLMAVSGLGYHQCTIHPTRDILELPDHVSKDAIEHIVDYFTYVCETKCFYLLPCALDNEFNAALLDASLVLGLDRHTYHIAQYLKAQIETKDGLMDYPELNAIIQRLTNHYETYDMGDQVLAEIGEVLAKWRCREQIPDLSRFDTWLQSYPSLADQMKEIASEEDTLAKPLDLRIPHERMLKLYRMARSSKLRRRRSIRTI